jgi:hypothetical protein
MQKNQKIAENLNPSVQLKSRKFELRTTVRAGVSLWGVGWWPEPATGPK